MIDHYVVSGQVGSSMALESAYVDLRRVVDIVLMGMPAEIRQTRIDVNGNDVHAYADPIRVRQIVRSLVNNALAYSGDRVFVLVSEAAGNGISASTASISS